MSQRWKLSRPERKRYRAALERVNEDEEMVCGVQGADGKFSFFVAPKDSSDEELEERAFELRHGRKFTDQDRMFATLLQLRDRGHHPLNIAAALFAMSTEANSGD